MIYFVYEKLLRWRLLGISHKTHNCHTRFDVCVCMGECDCVSVCGVHVQGASSLSKPHNPFTRYDLNFDHIFKRIFNEYFYLNHQ